MGGAKTDSRFRYEPDYVVLPGETLRDTLETLGMTQAELARRTGLSQKHINQIIQGQASISPETALALERVTGVPARFWNNLEANYQSRLARRRERRGLRADVAWLSTIPVKELIQRGAIVGSDDQITLVEQVFAFFGVASRAAWKDLWLSPQAAFRQSQAFKADPGAVATWLRLGELQASAIDCATFDRAAFREALSRLRTLTVEDPETFEPRLVDESASCGVAVSFVREIKGARVSGAARWLTPTKAMIQLSLRYHWEDHLWFSFFHEAAHILFHGKKEAFVDSPKDKRTDDVEEEANRLAETILIPAKYEAELWRLKDLASITAFADDIGIAPGIVVGRLQREGIIKYNIGNRLRRRYHVVD